MTFTQRPLQDQDDYPDFSKMIERTYQKRERVANKIPGWVKTGIRLYHEREDDSFSTFLTVIADIIKYDFHQTDYYFDLFLETDSCLTEGKSSDVPLDALQNLDFTGIFHVKCYFQWIDKHVPDVINHLYLEKQAEDKAARESSAIKEIEF